MARGAPDICTGGVPARGAVRMDDDMICKGGHGVAVGMGDEACSAGGGHPQGVPLGDSGRLTRFFLI